jgi:hypothetical protein
MSRRSTLFHFVSLAAFIAAGFQVVWFIVLMIGYETITSAWPTQLLGQILVSPDGAVIVQDRLPTGLRHRTPAGEPVPVRETAIWLQAAYLTAPLDERWRNTTLHWRSRTVQFSVARPPATDWFFVHGPVNEGPGYFVGYDVASKSLVGYLGRRGFRAALPPQEEWWSVAGPPYGRIAGFAGNYRYPIGVTMYDAASLSPRDHIYLVAEGQLWQIDLQRRMLSVLSEASDAISVAAATGVPRNRAGEPADDVASASETEYPHKGLLLRTGTEIVAMDFKGQRRAAWLLPARLRTETLECYELADGTALALAEQHYNGDTWFRDLWWIDHQGQIVRTARVELAPATSERGALQFFSVAALAPNTLLTLPFTLIARPLEAVDQGWQPNYPTALAHLLVEGWPALVVLCGLSGLLAWLAYRRQARFALPGPGVWAAFVFLFGLPGWLAYRWHRRWPVLERCSQCQQPAPRDRDACAACGHIFAPSPPLGTEIFA